jgi:3-mercaptopyruvate sulfurtransferase SseA
MKKKPAILLTGELLQIVDAGSHLIVDIRSVDAYNGWAMHGEKRGGHIPGAKSLPFKWSKYLDWLDVVQAKSILVGNNIVLYGDEIAALEVVAEKFIRAGYENISIYKQFLEEWIENEELPLVKLARYENLVYPDWVNSVINGNSVPNYKNEKFVLIHTHYRNREAYLSGHIPGAIDLDTNDVESPETWNRRTPEELKKTFESHGITVDTTVILYGKFIFPDNTDAFPGSAAGHIAAIRTAFIMMWAGIKDVRVLNGGFQSWKDAGYEISVEDVEKKAVAEYGAEIPLNPELAVDVPQAKEMLLSSDSELVCVRSWPEFIGEVSGYNYIEKKGRIPGAIFGNCGSDAYHMENYRNFDHTMREFQEIVEIWLDNKITPDKHLAFYCGTGWRGSEAFYNAWLMGWPRVSVFDGGWFEWSNDPGNPFETGIPQ